MSKGHAHIALLFHESWRWRYEVASAVYRSAPATIIFFDYMRFRFVEARSFARGNFLSPPLRPRQCGLRLAFCGLMYCVAGLGVCHAQSIASLVALARGSEPTYLSAKTTIEAAEARTDQMVGTMLPQVSASVNTNSNKRQYETLGNFPSTEWGRYNSNAAQVTVTQPLWRYANIVGWQQAEAVTEQARRQMEGAELDLVSKVITAWLDVLAARDGVQFTRQQASAAQRQWDIVRRGAELGSYSQPQAEEARAKYEQASADAAAAKAEVEVKQAALEQLVGPLNQLALPYMRVQAFLSDVREQDLATWLNAAATGNPSVLAATKAYEAAEDEVRKQSAGHQPTLDLVLNYNRNRQAVGGFPGQAGYNIYQGSAGVQLNIPIFSGGTQSAKVAEAVAQKEKTRLDIEAARRAAAFAVKQAWFGWQAAYARASAGTQAVKSARAALALAHGGNANGLKSELDVLLAEQQFHAAQRDFRKGRYDQVAAHVRLKAAVGTLSDKDIAMLDALFVNTPEESESLVQVEKSAVVASQ